MRHPALALGGAGVPLCPFVAPVRDRTERARDCHAGGRRRRSVHHDRDVVRVGVLPGLRRQWLRRHARAGAGHGFRRRGSRAHHHDRRGGMAADAGAGGRERRPAAGMGRAALHRWRNRLLAVVGHGLELGADRRHAHRSDQHVIGLDVAGGAHDPPGLRRTRRSRASACGDRPTAPDAGVERDRTGHGRARQRRVHRPGAGVLKRRRGTAPAHAGRADTGNGRDCRVQLAPRLRIQNARRNTQSGASGGFPRDRLCRQAWHDL